MLLATCALSACIGDLPEEDFPCLMAAGLYDKYNEMYVFSPQGDKKRAALAQVEGAEEQCKRDEARDPTAYVVRHPICTVDSCLG